MAFGVAIERVRTDFTDQNSGATIMSQGSIEVEIKVSVSNPDTIKQRILESGAKKEKTVTQIDVYLSHPCRDFSRTDEALRLRTTITPDGEKQFEMTYKGPKIDTTTKTRTETNTGVGDVQKALLLLNSLGFKEVATIKKHREFFRDADIAISLDDVEEIGTFVEVETIVQTEDEIDSAKSNLFDTLTQLGLSPKQSIRESYLELYLQRS